MSSKDDGITPAILLKHMQGMEERLTTRIDGVEQHLTSRIDRLEAKVDHNHAILSMQVENIDKRLDDIEVVQVPKLKKMVGMR